ncbi:Dual specificity protein phosphatase 9 [Linnemannia hyalina]|uniref:protein-tyrosine-phosphatase n=1 Tax=Linnemannia hyalina TaxID=64524 RepID=A0A9P7XUF6_9FUNG|nr:Dual specificity protein phosphatase 9 [Linnemannia hyalina]
MSLASPSTTSLSSRRSFIPAPLTSKPSLTVSTPSTSSAATTNTTTSSNTNTKRHSQVLLEDALPTQRLPIVSTPQHRSISAYFSDYSLECGAASPYISEPVCVLPNLYLGAEHNATNVKVLKRLGITFVLNVAIEIAQQEGSTATTTIQLDTSAAEEATRGSIEFKSLAWTHHQKDLLREFPTAFAMIDKALAASNGQGKALVHCQLGVSRSASLVIAYVMRARGMGLTEAYDYVKQRSGVISPNMSLMYQLAEFEKGLKKQGDGFFTTSEFATAPGQNRDSWCSQMGDDDEPPYPFSAAFSAADATPTIPSPFSSDMNMTPEIMIMDEPATPSRSEFYKRPLTPESRMEDHPSTKPFQGSNRPSHTRLALPASRRLSLTSSPQHSKFTPRSPHLRGAPIGLSISSNTEGATPRSFSLSPKTPIRDRFPTMTLPMSGDIEMMVPPTPLFQSSFSIPSLTSSSSSSSSASSVSSFEACSRPSISSTVSSSSYFTACDDDESALDIEFGYDTISPRNSGSWSYYPSAVSSGLLTWPMALSSASSSSSPAQHPLTISYPPESTPSLPPLQEPIKKKNKKAMWSGLKVLQVVTETSPSSSSSAAASPTSSTSSSSTSLYSSDLDDPSTALATTPTATTPTTAMVPCPSPAISTAGATVATMTATSAIMSKQTSLPDFIFSPRPYTPTHHRRHHESRTFGDFYQALCMEG